MEKPVVKDILIVEAFYCGSHKQLVDCLVKDDIIGPRVDLITMTGKKWHWRARVSALHVSTAIPRDHNFRVLFSSSVLNLAELVALRPDLAGLHKILYFHENQLQYPVRQQKDRDFQYGYNQILSCLVADCILFNSKFNMDSFLGSINSFLKLMPDYRPKGLADSLRPKCCVVYFPMLYCNTGHSPPNTHASADSSSFESTVTDHQTDSKSLSAFMVQQTGFGQAGGPQMYEGGKCHSSELSKGNEQYSSNFSSQLLEEKGGKSSSVVSQGFSCSDACINADEVKTDENSFVELHVSGNTHVKAGLKDVGDGCQRSTTSTTTSASVSHKSPQTAEKDHTPISADVDESRTVQPKKRKASEDGDDQVGVAPVTQPGLHGWSDSNCLHIVWPHRWEHDKDPETFFRALFRLQEEAVSFVVSVVGETFTDVPEIFTEAKRRLKDHIHTWGYQAEKSSYFQVLQAADVVVSTSKHEFFGVAMLEAVYLGCYPLCPKALVYPEIYPAECLYATPTQLYKRLRSFCRHPHLARRNAVQVDVLSFSWANLRDQYISKLQINL